MTLTAGVWLLLASCMLPSLGATDGSRPRGTGPGCREVSRTQCSIACGPGRDLVTVQCGALTAPMKRCDANTTCGAAAR